MREHVCDNCGRTTPRDDISDHGYLAQQYGWDFGNGGTKCPVCVYGSVKGHRLLNQITDIRHMRLLNKIEKRKDRKK